MVSDDVGQQLHGRATRGESLSSEEQAQLNEWYAEQDRAEAETLGVTEETEMITTLQFQIDSALEQLNTQTQQIRKISEKNEALRREIAALRRRVIEEASPQPV